MDPKLTRYLAEVKYFALANLAKDKFGYAVSVDVRSLSDIELNQQIEELWFLVCTPTS